MSEHTPKPECHYCGTPQGGMLRVCSSCVDAIERADKRSAMHDRLVAELTRLCDLVSDEDRAIIEELIGDA